MWYKYDGTVAVDGVITKLRPRDGELPDLEGYHQKEGIWDIKLGDDLSEDQRCMLKDLILRHPYVFTDIPGETDVIQHSEADNDTPIRYYPYKRYAMSEELQNEVNSMLEIGVVRPSTSPYTSPIVMFKKKDDSNRVCLL